MKGPAAPWGPPALEKATDLAWPEPFPQLLAWDGAGAVAETMATA